MYEDDRTLPHDVRKLPRHLKVLWRKTYNENDGDETAAQKAWDAVQHQLRNWP